MVPPLRALLPSAALVLALLPACVSGHVYPERMYEEVLELQQSHRGTGGLRGDVRRNVDRKIATVMRWSEEGLLETAEQKFWASVTLYESDREEHLVRAAELALTAAEEDEPRGNLAFAMASDKLSFHRGEAIQRYGTHWWYQPTLQRWEIHPPVDPLTTDAERAAMGVPPLAEIEAARSAANVDEETDALRRSVLKPPESP